jgi:hypothetical protein
VRWLGLTLALGIGVPVAVAVGEARGAGKPPGKLDVRSQYEESLVRAALLRAGYSSDDLDPAPEGKTIEAIRIDASKVILPGDLPASSKLPWTLLNRFHVRTRDEVIARELLFRTGDAFRRDLFEESGRNLRTLFILSVARLVAVRGSLPDRVIVLVVTKDQWSLRLNTSFAIDQARLDAFGFQFAEHNLLGRNKRVSFDFTLDPGRYGFGGSYTDPRIWGSRHALKIVGMAFFNRQSNTVEGGQLAFTIGRPLFALRTRFAWEAALTYIQDIQRYFSGGDLYLRRVGPPGMEEGVPDVFLRRIINASAKLTYSTGLVHKANFSVGFRVQDSRYGLPPDFPPEISAAARAAYAAILPRSESAAGPFVSMDLFTARYVRLQNIQTLALSEDFRLGPQLQLEARFAARHFGLSSDFGEISASFSDQRYFRDNLFQISAQAGLRVQAGVYPGSRLVNEYVLLQLRETSPRFGPLRLHLFGRINLRAHDLDNQRLTLGADSALRGFAPRQFQGNSQYRVNAELRTTALNLWTVHVGGVLFYDGGDAPVALNTYDRGGNFRSAGYHQDIGIGARILLPQFNRDVVRLDLAFPFERDAMGAYVPRFSAEFGQAF